MTQRNFRRRSIRLLALGAMLAGLGASVLPRAGLTAPRPHESPRAYCARVDTDDALHPPPPSLAPAIRRLFNIPMHHALQASYYRCAGGEVKVCFVGADLPCDKANTSRSLPAVTRWCETHPDTEFIPLYVTGHNSFYSWHCVGAKAETGAPLGPLDARGFFADYWKTVK